MAGSRQDLTFMICVVILLAVAGVGFAVYQQQKQLKSFVENCSTEIAKCTETITKLSEKCKYLKEKATQTSTTDDEDEDDSEEEDDETDESDDDVPPPGFADAYKNALQQFFTVAQMKPSGSVLITKSIAEDEETSEDEEKENEPQKENPPKPTEDAPVEETPKPKKTPSSGNVKKQPGRRKVVTSPSAVQASLKF